MLDTRDLFLVLVCYLPAAILQTASKMAGKTKGKEVPYFEAPSKVEAARTALQRLLAAVGPCLFVVACWQFYFNPSITSDFIDIHR